MAEEKTMATPPSQPGSQPAKPEQAKGLTLDPQDPDTEKLKEAIAARTKAYFAAARNILQSILDRRPQWMPARRELVLLYMSSENYKDAESFLIKEVARVPDDEWMRSTLMKTFLLTGNKPAEITFLKGEIAQKFDEPMLRRLFYLQRDSGDLEGALDTVTRLRKENDTVDLEVANARLLHALKRPSDAIKICETLLKKKPLPKGMLELFTTIQIADLNDPEAALRGLEALREEHLKDAEFLASMARVYQRMDRHKEALEYFKKALKLDAKSGHWWYDISMIQRQEGMMEDAQESLAEALRLQPLNPVALRVHGVEHKYSYGDEQMKQLNLAHANVDLFKDERKVELYYALAKAHEDLGELDTAFKYYEKGGALQTELTPYHHMGSVSVLKMTRDRVGQKTYENFSQPRCESDKPLFVLGMPRSGTTLSEQVIGTHPDAFGAGELKLLHRVLDGISINNRVIETKNDQGNMPTFIPGVAIPNCRSSGFKERGELYVKAIEALASAGGKPHAKRIIDKMPGNYFWTGVIPFVLPKAKIIHTQRHPLDNCLSNYRIFFPDGMPWSYDLRNLGKVYRAYFEHMAFWEKSLPEGVMLTVNYEVMVADFENQAKKIIQHVGLEWNPVCLQFYANERHVKTASLNQVRKPIYNTSVGRWKKYESYLKPLINELGPLIEEYEVMIEAKLDKLGKV
jgi:tetratricopeptide (TPR) repeat protein